MLVRTEAMRQIPQGPMRARVHTPMGVVEVLWRGDPQERDDYHRIEWTVDEEICWGRNTGPSTVAEPGLRQEGGRVIMRGQLHMDEVGGVELRVGDSSILFDLASPIPAGAYGGWVEIHVKAETVSVYPYEL